MKYFLKRLLKLNLGLFLCAVGIVSTLNAHIGYAPWEVFHVGLTKTIDMSLGTASILTGLVILVVAVFLGEKVGLGTILNMILIGIFIDVIIYSNIIPVLNHFLLGLLMMIAGLFIIAIGSYFYIGSGFGAGPRDSLMVALNRKTGLSIGVCRGIIELSAVFVGWRLGGLVGVGTIISAIGIGFSVQITFKLLKFNAASVRHETLDQTLKTLRYKKEEISVVEEASVNN
jgi:uncharacterized membrane protein YczE